MEEQINTNPYGFSKTKRETSLQAEEILFRSYRLYDQKAVRISGGKPEFVDNPTKIRLVDYIGGDDTIILAATNGFGLGIFRPSKKDFFRSLRTKKVLEPFKFTELKFHIECPIKPALIIVPYPDASVNEYSGRYSVMSDTFHIPEGFSENQIKGLVESYNLAYKSYEKFLEKDFTRELARSVLGLGNFTQFYWKLNLESLFSFISKYEARNSKEMKLYVDIFKKIARAVAPLSYEAFESVDLHGETSDLELKLNLAEIHKGREPLKDPHGISETKRLCIEAAEKSLFKPVRCLDNGFLSPIDYMGSDESVVQAARVSYGKGTKKVSQDKELARYLYRHAHTTPFEMIEIAFEAKLPFFVERQWVRHRTADKSGIFFPLSDFYIPEESQIREQAKRNKQGRADELLEQEKKEILDMLDKNRAKQKEVLEELCKGKFNESVFLSQGVGHFMMWFWKNDLKNTLHFLNLRLDAHAQYEIRVYANAMADFVKKVAPFSWKAFEDYTFNGTRFSSAETKIIKRMIAGEEFSEELMDEVGLTSKFERGEVSEKIKNLLEK